MEEENLPEESFGQVKDRVGNQETMRRVGVSMYIRITEIGLDYVVDLCGQSSKAVLDRALEHLQPSRPGTSRSRNDIWPARRHLSSAPVSVGRRIANMVAKIRDQMWKEVLEYASHMRVISIRTVERWQLSVAADSFALEYWLSAGSLPRNSAGGLTDRLITTIALWVRS